MAASGTYRGHVKVGQISKSRLEELRTLLDGVPIDNTPGSSWNCQNWVLSALELLKSHGHVKEHIDETFVRSELAKAEESDQWN